MLAICGTLMMDTIKETTKPEYVIAGGSLPYMVLAASKKTKPYMFSVLHDDWPKQILNMLKKYTDTNDIKQNTTQKSGKHFIHFGNDFIKVKTENECYNDFAKFPENMCDKIDTLLLGSIDPTIQQDIIRKTPHSFHITSLHDTLSMEQVDVALDVLKKSNIVFVSNETLRKMTNHRTYFDSIRHLAKTVMGIILVYHKNHLIVWDKKLNRKIFYNMNVSSGNSLNNPVGCIDALLGGLAGAIDSKMTYNNALEYGWALGMLSMRGTGFSELWNMSNIDIELMCDQIHFLSHGHRREMDTINIDDKK